MARCLIQFIYQENIQSAAQQLAAILTSESPFSTQAYMLKLSMMRPRPYSMKVESVGGHLAVPSAIKDSDVESVATSHHNQEGALQEQVSQQVMVISPALPTPSRTPTWSPPQPEYSGSTKRLNDKGRTILPALVDLPLFAPLVNPPSIANLSLLSTPETSSRLRDRKRIRAESETPKPTPRGQGAASRSTRNAEIRAQRFQREPTKEATVPCERCVSRNSPCILLESALNGACKECTKLKSRCNRSGELGPRTRTG